MATNKLDNVNIYKKKIFVGIEWGPSNDDHQESANTGYRWNEFEGYLIQFLLSAALKNILINIKLLKQIYVSVGQISFSKCSVRQKHK